MSTTPQTAGATTHALPSYLDPSHLGPWGIYLQQIDRVTPYLGSLARWVETLKRPKRILVVDVPIELDNELAISILVSVVSMTPGSLAADLSHDRRTLLVHGLDVPDVQAMIDEIKQRYEAPLKEIFPCSAT